ncbi:hypothetical protein [Clostridium butyricum]|uniref:hypothetical protein n=1 Tax=Clostridium butyricum TaxID=1492 RepID=UPI0013D0257D|nr:hypothetical protein [Clostridium butyricum]MCQ2016786.1 hypothetical protein [Clostridium butyricum]MCQ2023113.1 hypothetical protein [Clostridium butyricum]NFB69560.1 hypothetical protein [Clostridium butyricum]NFB90385.1 hypothetical protein [Clostridium butyricum]UTY54148.1 hypothetical protein HNS01_13965 [Clostridium butyricum]
MEFISAEEFRKQPVEVQKYFIDWFLENKSVTDLVQVELHPVAEIKLYSEGFQDSKLQFEYKKEYQFKGKKINGKYEITPLLTEGQLRKFIEDNTYCKLNIGNIGNIIKIYEKELDIPFQTDLLQAYWKVAIQIAEQL